MAELEKAKADTETKLEAALRSFTLQQAEIDRLQKSLASIDEERAANAARLTAANEELARLRPQADSAATSAAQADSLASQLAESQRLAAERADALARSEQALADARKTVDTATGDLVSARDQLRQTQAQAAATALENQQLKTRLALAGSLPASAVPSRPGAPSVPPPLAETTPAPAAASTPASPAAPRFHTVVPGDSLTRIARQYYGSASRWNEILEANRDIIRNPDSLALGTRLRIP